MKKQKPYFTDAQESKILGVFVSELNREGKAVSPEQINFLREYIQSPKHVYENAILTGVLDGEYLGVVKDNQIAYKAAPPSQEDVESLLKEAEEKANSWSQRKAFLKNERVLNMKARVAKGQIYHCSEVPDKAPEVPTAGQLAQVLHHKRAAKLSHALNMINLYGKPSWEGKAQKWAVA